jgi:hypothetical protein
VYISLGHSSTVELLYGTGERGKGKEKDSNIVNHNICEGRGYKDMY